MLCKLKRLHTSVAIIAAIESKVPEPVASLLCQLFIQSVLAEWSRADLQDSQFSPKNEQTNMSSQCAVCSKSATSHCSRCKVRPYCGRECQTKDWRTHKVSCMPPLSKYQKNFNVKLIPESLARSAVFEHSADGVDENIMLFFHGLGDAIPPYRQLFENMRLPQTAALFLSAPFPLPASMGTAWFQVFDFEDLRNEDLMIRPSASDKRRVSSLRALRHDLQRLLAAVRVAGWAADRIHLLGFSMGAQVALDLALCEAARGSPLGTCVASAA